MTLDLWCYENMNTLKFTTPYMYSIVKTQRMAKPPQSIPDATNGWRLSANCF